MNALVKLSIADIVRASPGSRQLAGADHRRDRGADRHRSRARRRNDQEARAAQRQARDRRFRPRLFLARRLKELPFAELKLDRTFVTDCGTDKVNAPLCKTVIDLAHNFGSVAVAIGIEKASDALALVSMGCDYGQGFLLGQPMPEERFVSLLRQRAATQGRPEGAAAAEKPGLIRRFRDRSF